MVGDRYGFRQSKTASHIVKLFYVHKKDSTVVESKAVRLLFHQEQAMQVAVLLFE